MSTTPFDGAWQLVSGECLDQGQWIRYDIDGIASRKVIAGGYFTFVTHKNGAFWSAGSGRVRHEEGVYTESPDMGTFAPEGMRDYVFTARLEGDLWHNARFENGERVEYEVWQRIGA
ncbi:hypothetical protein [Silvimonas iriomotensis]|uniref:DUF1579 domain-containing protein n=1 Tax=Silvimonas iriomotensis TaxID=449662 RepID=A0ABQ2P5M6_9NEIS|nr:hypothetical protein [Silvimonas iriomotensis]GGP18800.1 hypothetical protein GCM10010970_07350 [Silvimonas iriomotensis]